MRTNAKVESRKIRHVRIRRIVKGTGERPRLAVFRSLNHIYAQLIDTDGRTLATVGQAVAEVARQKQIEKVVFNRNGFLYHGRVKALADAAREAGLQF